MNFFSNKVLLVLATLMVVVGTTLILNARGGKSQYEAQKSSIVRTLEFNEHNVVTLFDEVMRFNSEEVANKIAFLNKVDTNEPIYLLLDSPGGSVIAGAKVVNSIEASRRPVHTVCITVCASMAAVIHSYGHKRLAMNRAILMYHDASGAFEGEFPSIKSLFETIERYVEKFDQNIVARSKIDRTTFETLQNIDLWIDTTDALAKGLVDEIVFVNTATLDIDNPTEAKTKREKATTKPRTTFEVNL